MPVSDEKCLTRNWGGFPKFESPLVMFLTRGFLNSKFESPRCESPFIMFLRGFLHSFNF